MTSTGRSGKILYLDAFAGAAGDMICASLIHLGVDVDALRSGLRALPLRGYRIWAEPAQRGPFAATRFRVEPESGGEWAPNQGIFRKIQVFPGVSVERAHDHDHAGEHAEGEHAQPERSWREIRAMLEAAPLPPRARARALAVFTRLAEAEARVHGATPEEITFHEVGAVDSIVDIVGATLALELLDVDHIVASPLPMGSGQIRSAHGLIPLPAPAVVEVLRGWPVVPGPPGREHVTPTGAALIAALAKPGTFPAMTVLGVGYGAGTRDPADVPNVLRAVLGQPAVPSSELSVELIEAQMDDLPGEHLPPLLDALFEAGAIDAFSTPVLMKKGRPGLLVTALASAASAPAVEVALLRHSSSFGVRRSSSARRVLDRRHERVATPWGEVRIKLGFLDGAQIHAAPEFEDVRTVARAAGVPVPEVHAAAVAAWRAGRSAAP